MLPDSSPGCEERLAKHMETLTPATQHGRTMRMDIHDIVRELNAALGPTLVSALSGSKERRLPIRRAKADGPEPCDSSAEVRAPAVDTARCCVRRARRSPVVHRREPASERERSDHRDPARIAMGMSPMRRTRSLPRFAQEDAEMELQSGFAALAAALGEGSDEPQPRCSGVHYTA